MTRPLRSFLVIAVALAALATPAPAHAKTASTLSYPLEQVFPTAIRLLRIDERHKIVEKDADAGYILFEVAEEGRTYRGSLEVAAVTDDEGRAASRVIVRMDDRPAYMEQGLIDRLKRKLLAEVGEPAPPPEKRRPRKPAKDDRDDADDADRDDDNDNDNDKDKDRDDANDNDNDDDVPRGPKLGPAPGS